MPDSPSGVNTNVLPGDVRELRFRRFILRVVDGPDRGRERMSSGAELSVGSAASNDLVLTDPTVSRHHFVLQVGPDGVVLRDLDSTNGTTLAGYRVGSAHLRPGAIIGLGLTTLRLDELAEEVREPLSEFEQFGRAIGRSVPMRRLFAALQRIAAADSTVLIEGETGTGKGIVAEAIHSAGTRAGGPFVVVDCASIPPSLIEAELFGHTRGAFTGAGVARAGAFESAAGGTVFLDEIGELPLDMQPKLLRALEERIIKRVGSVEPIQLDVRVIAATNRNLRQAVNRGTFRADLYFRLNIVRIEVPPLRDRRDDIALLATSFYEQFAAQPGAIPPPGLIDRLMRLDWPGNVRELRNAVERAVLMQDPELWQEVTSGADDAGGGPIAGLGGYQFEEALSFRLAKERVMSHWERWYVTELVRRHAGNLSRAARAARMDRTHLRELVLRYQAK
ncbi:MAG TPA: sigma 54-dependent Fis family transcriptional regulator [Kofleriaceae bacterium]|jgi:DNA-binding NtrC family response regulator|nr:sigma 54-dependent Fis family transcriptional regulator [Kofleriaceae bacterium]